LLHCKTSCQHIDFGWILKIQAKAHKNFLISM
jgi:hypothetical protein